MQLRIPFSEIPEQGMRLAISNRSWLPEELHDTADQVNADLLLVKKNESRIEIQGDLRAKFRLSCDRCLAYYPFELTSKLQLIVEMPQESRHWHLQDMEVEGTGGDLDTLQVIEPVLDLEDILRQQVYLGLPAKRLCRDNCLGLCSHCGGNLNERQCSCHDEKSANSPFAALAAYQKKKRN